jgi:hypothetical protein
MPYKLDTSDLITIAMSAARVMPARVELSDGSSRPDPNGRQAMHKITGLPVYQVDAVIPGAADDPKSRMTAITVKVASATPPQVTPGLPVRFDGLAITVYTDSRTNQAAISWSSDGAETVVPAPAGRRAEAA